MKLIFKTRIYTSVFQFCRWDADEKQFLGKKCWSIRFVVPLGYRRRKGYQPFHREFHIGYDSVHGFQLYLGLGYKWWWYKRYRTEAQLKLFGLEKYVSR